MIVRRSKLNHPRTVHYNQSLFEIVVDAVAKVVVFWMFSVHAPRKTHDVVAESKSVGCIQEKDESLKWMVLRRMVG